MSLTMTKLSKTGEFDLVLNHKDGDIVNHSLVLLEGEITLVNDNSLTDTAEEMSNTLEKNTADVENYCCSGSQELSSLQEIQILVEHKESCQSWPVVGGKFKAFVKLDKGINELEIGCPSLQYKQRFTLTFTNLENQPRFVKVVYVKCCDSEGMFDSPTNADNDLCTATKKLRFNALLLQTFMAVDMYKHGFGYETFCLEEDDDGEVLVHVFGSKLTTEQAHAMNGDQLYSWFHSELLNSSLNNLNCKFLVFMSCTHYDPPDDFDVTQTTKYVKAHTALGGGQLGLFGTGGLHTWAKDVEELLPCFTDSREINKSKLFDDSAGRGTFWANYSTTLGAALHELGHCFDLMHTPEGIMGRGFDDMNHFVMVTQPENQHHPTTELTNNSNDVTLEIFADHKAHWFRSSAVILHYHKWIRPCTELSFAEEENKRCHQVNWSCNVRGPVGNGGGGQKNQSYFDDGEWCSSNGVVFSGYVVYHSEYLNALKLLTVPTLENSEVHGQISEKCSVHIFSMVEGEHLTSVEVRAGAWVDGIRFHTNMKSSIWFGGRGGNWYHLKPNTGDPIMGIFGTFGDFMGSLGIRVGKKPPSSVAQPVTSIQIQSDVGIGLVELRKKDEMIKFWEFVAGNLPTEFDLPLPWSKIEEDVENCSIFVVDCEGNVWESGFVGIRSFLEGTRDLDGAEKGITASDQVSCKN